MAWIHTYAILRHELGTELLEEMLQLLLFVHLCSTLLIDLDNIRQYLLGLGGDLVPVTLRILWQFAIIPIGQCLELVLHEPIHLLGLEKLDRPLVVNLGKENIAFVAGRINLLDEQLLLLFKVDLCGVGEGGGI